MNIWLMCYVCGFVMGAVESVLYVWSTSRALRTMFRIEQFARSSFPVCSVLKIIMWFGLRAQQNLIVNLA
jgi:hypothetical protein